MNIGSVPIDAELLIALVAVAVAWGSLNQRLKAMEVHAPKFEAFGRFEERLDRLAQDMRDLAEAVRDLVRVERRVEGDDSYWRLDRRSEGRRDR